MGLVVGVIGPAGFSGSHLSIELINRGHSVRGISRYPEKLGSHSNYRPYSIDIETCSLLELTEAFRSLDVLVNAYGPHTGGEHALQYSEILPCNISQYPMLNERRAIRRINKENRYRC
jgi:putative NADH-flavin reductase